jgi:hypothetical protein
MAIRYLTTTYEVSHLQDGEIGGAKRVLVSKSPPVMRSSGCKIILFLRIKSQKPQASRWEDVALAAAGRSRAEHHMRKSKQLVAESSYPSLTTEVLLWPTFRTKQRIIQIGSLILDRLNEKRPF